MNSIARQTSSIFRLPRYGGMGSLCINHQVQQCRGIRVKVFEGNLERALGVMQNKMKTSGMDRILRRQVRHHIKNSEKRVLARKMLEHKIQSQDLARKLKSILIKKVRGL